MKKYFKSLCMLRDFWRALKKVQIWWYIQNMLVVIPPLIVHYLFRKWRYAENSALYFCYFLSTICTSARRPTAISKSEMMGTGSWVKLLKFLLERNDKTHGNKVIHIQCLKKTVREKMVSHALLHFRNFGDVFINFIRYSKIFSYQENRWCYRKRSSVTGILRLYVTKFCRNQNELVQNK